MHRFSDSIGTIAAALAKAQTEITNPDSPGYRLWSDAVVRWDMLGILAGYAPHTHVSQKISRGGTKILPACFDLVVANFNTRPQD
jgi:hypothetical protein